MSSKITPSLNSPQRLECVAEPLQKPSASSLLSLVMILLAIALLFMNISPLGTSERANRYSQDIFNRCMSSMIYPTKARDEITVLLLTDETVDRFNQGKWPLAYDFHGRVLNQLLNYSPKAVFIDMMWLNMEKPGVNYLLRVLERYKQQNIQIFIVAESEEIFFASWPELQGLVIPVSAQIALDKADFISRLYPVNNGNLDSAAFSIAKNLNIISGGLDSTRSMDIFWSSVANPDNDWINPPENKSKKSLYSSISSGIWDVNENNPYHRTLFVRDLLTPVHTSDDTIWSQAESILTDKIIFYGANVTGVQDFVFTPNKDILPGVYYHAMAFDNLLTWGDSYKSADIKYPYFIQPFVILPLIIALVLNRFRILGRTPIHETACDYSGLAAFGKSLLKMLALNSCFLIPIFLWSIFVVLVLFYFFDTSTGSWFGFIEVMGLGFFLNKLTVITKLQAMLTKNRGKVNA